MFHSLLKKFSDLEAKSILERLDEYKIVIFCDSCSAGRSLAHANSALDLAKSLSSRDRFEFEIDFDGDSKSILQAGELGKAEARAHLDEHDELGSATYTITIRKPLGSNVSVYDLKRFGEYLHSEALPILLSALSSRFKDKLTFECKELDARAGTSTIHFVPWAEEPQNLECDDSHKRKILVAFRENSYSLGVETGFIPSDFYLVTDTAIGAIDSFMKTACSVLSAIFISSSSEILPNRKLRYKLLGYKTIEDEVSFTQLSNSYEDLYKLYSWAYAAGESADRIGLVRNILSLHIDRLPQIVDRPGLWTAIYSNYQIYLKENVAAYLEIKNKISEFLVESTSKAHDLVEQLVESLKNSVFLILTFLLSVVVVNGLKDNGLTVVFSAEYIYIVIGLWLVLTLWIGGAVMGSLRRLDQASETTDKILKEAYGRMILESEISSSVDPIIRDNRAYLVKQCIRYSIYWVVISAVVLIGFIVGHKLFA